MQLETLISEVLPGELKAQVLKELLRLWATKIPLRTLKCNPWYTEFSKCTECYEATNRAALAYITRPRGKKRRSRGRARAPKCHLGWCAIPAASGLDHHLRFLSHISGAEGPYEIMAMGSMKCWADHPFRIANILANSTFSKELGPMMETFFFGHMIWEIPNISCFGGMTSKIDERGSRNMLGKIKNISIPLSSEWSTVACLCEMTFTTLAQTALFPKIESLELNGRGCRLKRYNGEALDECTRIRWLVTWCYKLVKLYPRLTICLKGYSNYDVDIGSDHRLNEQEVFEQAAKNLRYVGFGFTKEEELRFEDGTFEDVHKLPSFEYQVDGDDHTPLSRAAETDWKIRFSQEWRQILAQGIDVPAAKGGYPAVSYWRDTYCSVN